MGINRVVMGLRWFFLGGEVHRGAKLDGCLWRFGPEEVVDAGTDWTSSVCR